MNKLYKKNMKRKTKVNIVRNEIETMEKNSYVLDQLQKLFILNQKEPKKINDNLIKLVANVELLSTAYEKLKKNKGL